MKFKHGTRRRALEYEKDWVQRWKEDGTFEKSVENRSADDAYVFYDGPPFITGNPHHGTLLSSIVKDAVPRYWTMKGKRVERVWGWDCHGLPAENFVEKQLNIVDRRQIVISADDKAPLDKDGNELPTVTLEHYITKARESMVANSATWEDTVDRIGRWVDFKGAYKTMDKDFMESVWWAFKELYEKGKIYEGEKVLMFDTKFATPVSKNEVTMDNDAYQTVTDPSVFVKFKLKDGAAPVNVTYFVHGTTTDNQNKKSTGWNEGELSDLGIQQSKELPALIGDKNFDAIFCSDLKRAVDSAKLNFPNSKIIQDERLRECNYGDLNGADSELVVDDDHVDKAFPNGESLKDVEMRMRSFCDFLAENYAGKDVAIVAHKVPQFALQVITEGKTWSEVIENDWRKEKKWQPGWEYSVSDSAYLLAWTTTPWTLPGNLMLAVSPELTYCEVEVGGEKLIIAEEALERVLKDEKNQPLEHKVVRKFSGSELVGKSYQPLDTGSTWPENDTIHKVYAADFVSHESGSGIVHIAPAYGEDDFELAKSHGVGAFHVIDDNGYYTDTNYKGLEVWDNNKFIAKDLKEKGIVWKIDYIRHEYPFNPRSKQRIMYRAIPSWFFDIQGSKPLMLEQNENINWFPEHLKHGRFAKNIEQAPDWNLSRDRFWATAMPVWKGDKGTVKVIGSYAELKELSGVELEDYHRPWVDDITFEIDGEHFVRVDKVLDCWFESGSMPFAQLHYPFENKEKFEANYPADFIVEYVGQVRAWFYYVHAVNTALFGEHAFNNVITTGVVAGNDGRKMSKSLGNYTDPNELMDKFSADSLRFLLLGSPLLNGEDFALHDKDVGDVARKLSMIWNMYDFFTMYAEVDGWEFDGTLTDPLETLTNPLDIWIVSRLHELIAEVEKHMDGYNIPDALSPILPFLDDASNWFVRRSRRRFWKSEDDGDKNDAYKTLHYVLVRLAYILAPFTPFLAEELYHNLTGDEESIHLKDWLPAGGIDDLTVQSMELTRKIVNEGLSARAKAGIKVRQPLGGATVVQAPDFFNDLPIDTFKYYESIITEELNIKELGINYEHMNNDKPEQPEFEVMMNTEITPELKREGLMREVVRLVQNARKNAGLNVDDRVALNLTTEDGELRQAIEEHKDVIATETLTEQWAANDGYNETAKIDDAELRISLQKH